VSYGARDPAKEADKQILYDVDSGMVALSRVHALSIYEPIKVIIRANSDAFPTRLFSCTRPF
jgi:hypothetical protein